MIITIDGPVATGKSTVAKKLASAIGFIYYDTGAIYRSLTYALMKEQIDLNEEERLNGYLNLFPFDILIEKGEKRYLIGEEDITDKIRLPDVTAYVSEVSANKNVRLKLLSIQRDLSLGVNAVFEGRDMGTTVFPNAEIKIFLTGRPEVRAKRRFDEMMRLYQEVSYGLTYEKMLEEINRRDTYDMQREISPLRQPEDAYVIDTSDLTLDEIVYKILDYRDASLTNREIPSH
jgi:cytidylate kinase